LKQSNGVNLRITVRELVSFGRFPYSKGRLTSEDQEMIEYALEKLSLVEMADDRIDTLSGGQLQRAYIAMILAQDTDYILLDEPLNNLDMNHAVQLMQTLRRLVEEEHKTVLLVIHDINFAASYADEIVAMKDGKIFAHGTTAEMIQPHILNTLYEMDIKICELDGKRFCMYFN
jgi:iron complex transport system ATP-binding protein